LLLLLFGPLLFIGTVVLANSREQLAGNLSLRRVRQAKRDRARLLKRLEHVDGDVFEVVRGEVVPWLIEYLDLPRGTTVSELRDQVTDEELAEVLEAAQQGAFMPGAATQISGSEIGNRLRRFTSVLVLGAALTPALSPQILRAAELDPMKAAAERYYAQEFDNAIKQYEKMARNGEDSWQLRYNLGNCLFRQGRYAAAVANYERALRLAPRQSDVLQNLNFTRRQLGMPAARNNDSPTAMLGAARDLLRPDEWIFLACLGWFGCFVALSIFRFRRKRIRPWILLPAAIALVGCISAFIQTRTSYRDGQAIVVALETATRPFPDAEKTTGSPLTAGREIHILERRDQWTRIRVDEAEGWIPNTDYQTIW
jgi:tetratricopeptide (TPR) repeat protein